MIFNIRYFFFISIGKVAIESLLSNILFSSWNTFYFFQNLDYSAYYFKKERGKFKSLIFGTNLRMHSGLLLKVYIFSIFKNSIYDLIWKDRH